MLNVNAAKSAAMSVAHLAGSNVTNALPMVPMMAKTEIQVTGVYDLIFPDLHIDFATRQEIEMYIKQTLLLHHQINWHLPIAAVTPAPGSPIGSPGMTPALPTPIIPKEVVVNKIKVRAGSPVNSVGYGI